MPGVAVAGTRGPATPRSSLTAADPVVAGNVALHAGLERPEGTGGVVQGHPLTAGGGVRRRVFPVLIGAAHSVVDALREGGGRRIDRPEGRDGSVGGVLQANQITRRRGGLQLRVRARVRAREIHVAGGVGAGKPEGQVVVEATGGGRQRPLEDLAGRGSAGRAGGRGGGGRGGGRRRAGGIADGRLGITRGSRTPLGEELLAVVLLGPAAPHAVARAGPGLHLNVDGALRAGACELVGAPRPGFELGLGVAGRCRGLWCY